MTDDPMTMKAREEIARIIDPTAWKLDRDGYLVEQVHSEQALAKADRVLAALADRPAAGAQEVERLREALEPFAKCCEQIDDSESDEEWAKFRLLIGDYRRARAALAALPQPPEAL